MVHNNIRWLWLWVFNISCRDLKCVSSDSSPSLHHCQHSPLHPPPAPPPVDGSSPSLRPFSSFSRTVFQKSTLNNFSPPNSFQRHPLPLGALSYLKAHSFLIYVWTVMAVMSPVIATSVIKQAFDGWTFGRALDWRVKSEITVGSCVRLLQKKLSFWYPHKRPAEISLALLPTFYCFFISVSDKGTCFSKTALSSVPAFFTWSSVFIPLHDKILRLSEKKTISFSVSV